jgi:hypothetical protein
MNWFQKEHKLGIPKILFILSVFFIPASICFLLLDLSITNNIIWGFNLGMYSLFYINGAVDIYFDLRFKQKINTSKVMKR